MPPCRRKLAVNLDESARTNDGKSKSNGHMRWHTECMPCGWRKSALALKPGGAEVKQCDRFNKCKEFSMAFASPSLTCPEQSEAARTSAEVDARSEKNKEIIGASFGGGLGGGLITGAIVAAVGTSLTPAGVTLIVLGITTGGGGFGTLVTYAGAHDEYVKNVGQIAYNAALINCRTPRLSPPTSETTRLGKAQEIPTGDTASACWEKGYVWRPYFYRCGSRQTGRTTNDGYEVTYTNVECMAWGCFEP